jgi:signal transduction histidine kinase
VTRFAGVGARLSLALALVVAVALGVAYALVVPLLERNLVDAKLDQLAAAAEQQRQVFPLPALRPRLQFALDEYVRDASDATNARVVLFDPLAGGAASVIADSRQTTSDDIIDNQVALTAVATLEAASGSSTRAGARYADVAFPVDVAGTVVLFTAPLEDTLATVTLVKRRVLIAGAIALCVALALGFSAASLFARRIRRLERAADRIAGGRLDEPVETGGSDELGQLAKAFEHMRGRLAQLERARREFIANASHELRTPLFSLGGFLELLADEDLDEDTRREFLETMREQVARLTKLATELLDLSRLDAGRLHVEREPVDLRGLGEDLVEEFGPVARQAGRPLRFAVEGEPVALADDQRVLQIGRALVENALRHTPAGTPVTVRARAGDDSPELAVEDEGPGIAAEHVDHVFGRFYRADGTRASGSGLGLAIARELAEVMGGTLTVESRPGRTVFRLRLPLAVRGRTAAPVPVGSAAD